MNEHTKSQGHQAGDDGTVPTALTVGTPLSWQPIETAPKDGREVMLSGVAFQRTKHRAMWVSMGWYSADQEGWWEANTDPTDAHDGQVAPTHWMPLPPPPVQLQGAASPRGEIPDAENAEGTPASSGRNQPAEPPEGE